MHIYAQLEEGALVPALYSVYRKLNQFFMEIEQLVPLDDFLMRVALERSIDEKAPAGIQAYEWETAAELLRWRVFGMKEHVAGVAANDELLASLAVLTVPTAVDSKNIDQLAEFTKTFDKEDLVAPGEFLAALEKAHAATWGQILKTQHGGHIKAAIMSTAKSWLPYKDRVDAGLESINGPLLARLQIIARRHAAVFEWASQRSATATTYERLLGAWRAIRSAYITHLTHLATAVQLQIMAVQKHMIEAHQLYQFDTNSGNWLLRPSVGKDPVYLGRQWGFQVGNTYYNVVASDLATVRSTDGLSFENLVVMGSTPDAMESKRAPALTWFLMASLPMNNPEGTFDHLILTAFANAGVRSIMEDPVHSFSLKVTGTSLHEVVKKKSGGDAAAIESWKQLKTVFDEKSKEELHMMLGVYLVMQGARRAMLVESANIKPERYVIIRQSLAGTPNVITKEQVSNAPRLLVYTDSKLENIARIAMKNEKAMGAILGFACPGELGAGTRIGWTITLQTDSLGKEPIEVTAEMCSTQSLKEKRLIVEQKVKQFEAALRKAFPDAQVKLMEAFQYGTADLVRILKELVDNGKSTELDSARESIANWFENYAFKESEKRVLQKSPIVDTQSARVWLVLMTFIDHDPTTPMHPLTPEQNTAMSERLQMWEKVLYSLFHRKQ